MNESSANIQILRYQQELETLPIDELDKRYQDLNAAWGPIHDQRMEVAAKVVSLQLEMFRRRLIAEFPSLPFENVVVLDVEPGGDPTIIEKHIGLARAVMAVTRIEHDLGKGVLRLVGKPRKLMASNESGN
jgi:hypothetical protein